MQRRESGLTLIEVMVVVSVVAISGIAIPGIAASRLRANEALVIATLEQIAAAQLRCRERSAVEVGSGGRGAFGYFAELMGKAGPRAAAGGRGTRPPSPPVLPPSFADVTVTLGVIGGVVKRSGYLFQIYLPDSTGAGLPEAPAGGVSITTAPDHALSEQLWCCYAWPVSFGESGARAFFVNQSGVVISTNNQGRGYSGGNRPPDYTAALARGSRNGMASSLATDGIGGDGQMWTIER